MRFVVSVLLLGALTVLTLHCTKADPATAEPPKTYLFLGHTYDWLAEGRVDPRLELIDYSQFDGVWLGGDVCARTSKSETTLQYLDSLFQLSDPNTHWSWGNHDLLEGDASLLLRYTGRPSYYTYYEAGLLMIVLNTNLFWHHTWAPPHENCAAKEKQYSWLKNVLDTVSTASEVLILHHHGLLNEFKTAADGTALNLGNVDAIPVRPLCDSTSNFTTDIYPKLQAIRQRGIGLTMLSGDVGMRSKGYAITTADSITMLGSGINNNLDMRDPAYYVTNFEPDSVLLLSYSPAREELTWEFRHLSNWVLEDFIDPEVARQKPRLWAILSEY